MTNAKRASFAATIVRANVKYAHEVKCASAMNNAAKAAIFVKAEAANGFALLAGNAPTLVKPIQTAPKPFIV